MAKRSGTKIEAVRQIYQDLAAAKKKTTLTPGDILPRFVRTSHSRGEKSDLDYLHKVMKGVREEYQKSVSPTHPVAERPHVPNHRAETPHEPANNGQPLRPPPIPADVGTRVTLAHVGRLRDMRPAGMEAEVFDHLVQSVIELANEITPEGVYLALRHV